MSVIRTWKQYDKLDGTAGCDTEWSIGPHEKRQCGSYCKKCEEIRYCATCSDIVFALEVFERKQLAKARAAYDRRKKAGGK